MHYHTEIIMPPTDDIEAAVESIMKPFDENDKESHHSFWDWYVIGGRFAGSKLLLSYDQEKIDEFYEWLKAEKVTVSGVQCGKQEISPADQIPKVDAKWNELFPQDSDTMVACPIFAHSNDQYGRDGKGTIDGDVCPLKDALAVKCSRVIIAGPSYDFESKEYAGPLKAVHMLCDTEWNGVNHMSIVWDETVGGAVEDFKEQLDRCTDEYRERVTPQDDWLSVTVDYHS